MMRSTYGDNDDEEEDAFARNPFRGEGRDNDLLGAPMPPQQHHHQQQQQHPLQPQATYPPPQQQQQQQQSYYPQQQQQQQQQQLPPQHYPLYPDPQQQQQQQQQQPVYLSGSMDQGGAPAGKPASSAEIPSTPIGPCSRLTSCFRLEGYQPYFDLDTTDVQHRLMASLTQFWLPDQFRTVVIGDTKDASRGWKGPDLYGPLWITMTLIFALAATSNMSHSMLHHHAARHPTATTTNNITTIITTGEVEAFEYDMNILVRSSTILAMFVVGLPTALWLACTCLAMPNIPWAMWVCVYGYSMTPYLVGTLLAWIPNALWQWLVLTAATVASGLLVVRNLATPLLSQDSSSHAAATSGGSGAIGIGGGDHHKASPIIMSILGAHFVFLLILKFAFYS